MPAAGQKYRTAQGFTAIKDGIKRIAAKQIDPPQPKPPWLRVRIGGDGNYANVRRTVREHALSTVCEESHCPNIGECWNAGTAHHHADGQRLHPCVPLLRGGHGQSTRLAGFRRARQRGPSP